MRESRNINDSCILDLQWHVIAKSENSSEEIARRCQNKGSDDRKYICASQARVLCAKF